MTVKLEGRAKDCYSNLVPMLGHDFVEMMLLDGCFVVELLRLLGESEDSIDEEDPIFTRPWLIPPLIRDLLKLENQLLFFILDSLFSWSRGAEETETLPLLALKVFDLALPRSPEAILPFQHLEAKHLLHLFHQSLLPPQWVMMTDPHRPADQPMQCVTRLRPSGIKFKSCKADSLLDIKY
ncbi:hypothetical protein VitviT2T_009056 [Vitis vinifera]|uniref:Uncharacterized protein n=1 Tax=Vitis vinifera TaxID=29760 RepID=A0ABY9C4C6_VITVI|nr:hypothetical protein VitviT2T_009056 [Vitis vinifera]|eukprot:XP_019076011.1 PREDICTED: UPF0481 protein At3g47200-like [Vitis vinifera]